MNYTVNRYNLYFFNFIHDTLFMTHLLHCQTLTKNTLHQIKLHLCIWMTWICRNSSLIILLLFGIDLILQHSSAFQPNVDIHVNKLSLSCSERESLGRNLLFSIFRTSFVFLTKLLFKKKKKALNEIR